MDVCEMNNVFGQRAFFVEVIYATPKKTKRENGSRQRRALICAQENEWTNEKVPSGWTQNEANDWLE